MDYLDKDYIVSEEDIETENFIISSDDEDLEEVIETDNLCEKNFEIKDCSNIIETYNNNYCYHVKNNDNLYEITNEFKNNIKQFYENKMNSYENKINELKNNYNLILNELYINEQMVKNKNAEILSLVDKNIGLKKEVDLQNINIFKLFNEIKNYKHIIKNKYV